MDEKLKEETFKRMTSPWFFTFIPWWIVFNYDFLILVFGKKETLNAVRTYYKCDFINTKLSIFGCIDFYGWGNNQFFWKLLFPIIATVVSMTAIAWFISLVTNLYERISHKTQIRVLTAQLAECRAQYKKTQDKLQPYTEELLYYEFYREQIRILAVKYGNITIDTIAKYNNDDVAHPDTQYQDGAQQFRRRTYQDLTSLAKSIEVGNKKT